MCNICSQSTKQHLEKLIFETLKLQMNYQRFEKILDYFVAVMFLFGGCSFRPITFGPFTFRPITFGPFTFRP